MPAAPPPGHVLRSHAAQLSALAFSADNERVYSGDVLGVVCVTSTRTLRPLAQWQAHSDGVLGVEEWGENVITHGRDNRLVVWARAWGDGAQAATPALEPASAGPAVRSAMDVNALNFCRFSLCPISRIDGAPAALVALPNLVESSLADVWLLPAGDRLHAAIAKHHNAQHVAQDSSPRGDHGIIMSLHLFQRNGLHLVTAFEDGTVALWANTTDGSPTVNGQGWQPIWLSKLHAESVMAMAVSPAHDFVLTVSADHLIGRYSLGDSSSDTSSATFESKHAGNSAVAIRSDGRVCAVAGWDGKLYSTKSLKSLGTLTYHREGCFCLAFAHPTDAVSEDPADPLALTEDELGRRSQWLAAGSKDSRISIWQLSDLDRKG